MIDALIDLSHYQTGVDLGAMRDSGIVGVILKASQGASFVDPTFTPGVTKASDEGKSGLMDRRSLIIGGLAAAAGRGTLASPSYS